MAIIKLVDVFLQDLTWHNAPTYLCGLILGIERFAMIKISTRGRYGLLAMVELARQDQSHPTQLTAIADKYGLSRKYLHNLMTSLRNQGLVRTQRGAMGGFLLAQPATETSAWEILTTLEGFEPKVERSEFTGSAKVVNELVDDLGVNLRDQLLATSLAQLVARTDQETSAL